MNKTQLETVVDHLTTHVKCSLNLHATCKQRFKRSKRDLLKETKAIYLVFTCDERKQSVKLSIIHQK